ncbi:MAG: hypothetical protein K0R16_1960 [Nitrososphaeraceae archaeon]|jgi:hypothetical protein|nr:hypothetical protein [Nitrososphaeraceae archaeon]MDF2769675.1 hypothetical protein [Nitrososphaeraceae archaeon]
MPIKMFEIKEEEEEETEPKRILKESDSDTQKGRPSNCSLSGI